MGLAVFLFLSFFMFIQLYLFIKTLGGNLSINDSPLFILSDANKVISFKKNRKFLCDNHSCLAELNVNLTDIDYSNRFYFTESLNCPICGIGNMYVVKEG
jgi:hypothetical protein